MKAQQTSSQELNLRKEAAAATEGNLSMQQQHPTKNSSVESGRLRPGGYVTSLGLGKD